MMDYSTILSECKRVQGELQVANDAYYKVEYPHSVPEPVRFIEGRKWHKLDIGTSGAFMVRIDDGLVVGIKAYGVPHMKAVHGYIDKITGAQLLPRRFARANTPPIEGGI